MVTATEDEPILIQIAAAIPGTDDTDGLEVYVDNIPTGSTFSRGSQEGNRWIFTPLEFGEVQLDLPPGFSGMLNLEITAVTPGASRQRLLIINIQSISNATEAVTSETPTMTGQTVGQTPAVTGQTPAATGETPGTSRETPAITGETPTTIEETPGTSRETPAVTGETPTAIIEETPGTSRETPSETTVTTEDGGKISYKQTTLFSLFK